MSFYFFVYALITAVMVATIFYLSWEQEINDCPLEKIMSQIAINNGACIKTISRDYTYNNKKCTLWITGCSDLECSSMNVELHSTLDSLKMEGMSGEFKAIKDNSMFI